MYLCLKKANDDKISSTHRVCQDVDKVAAV